MEDILLERFELAGERIREIAGREECVGFTDSHKLFFETEADWLLKCFDLWDEVEAGDYRVAVLKERNLQDLLEANSKLYRELSEDAYSTSLCNPQYAVSLYGNEFGRLFSFLAAEFRSLISFAFEQNRNSFLIRCELFLEVYNSFVNSYDECKKAPDYEEVKNIVYWFVSDYAETEILLKIKNMVDPTDNFFVRLIESADLSTPEYLFAYGECISEDEIRLSRFMAALSKEKVQLMADTYTEGYRIGFETTNKDLSKKKTVNIRYVAGLERMVKAAIENFRKMGLEPTIYRAPQSVMNGRTVYKSGFLGKIVNKQYEYDHKDDLALIFDRKLSQRMLEESRAAYEVYKEWANLYAGPAVIETFGDIPFAPAVKEANLRYDGEQQKLRLEQMNQMQALVNEYINGEETSFTIIAFPVPQIGEQFEEIFDKIIEVNTLPYKKYEQIQNTIITALNSCVAVEVKGMNGNRTDLHISLYPIQDEEKEVIFENCVADVNIPVGEVFTSPVLKGTEGLLHVSEVFLNELKYEDLSIWFKDGMISGYDCGNFKEPKENQKYIKENILFHHESIPMGEFAIGTNTYAYTMGRTYKIQDRLPILIAEKTGPHFAVGDTCYSHAEDVEVHNPDGREIVAKDNEISLKRKTQPEEAYFNCHTDITIPYNELGELYGIRKDGSKIMIIQNGRFVLPGTEELNKPLEEETSVTE